MSELKNCPFCGSKAEIKAWDGWYVECETCEIKSGVSLCTSGAHCENTEKEAVDIWNSRPSPWVSVKDSLPPEDVRVYVWASYHAMAYLDDGIWKDSSSSTSFMDHISHWAPLHESPYK